MVDEGLIPSPEEEKRRTNAIHELKQVLLNIAFYLVFYSYAYNILLFFFILICILLFEASWHCKYIKQHILLFNFGSLLKFHPLWSLDCGLGSVYKICVYLKSLGSFNRKGEMALSM